MKTPASNRRMVIYALLFTMAMINYMDRVALSVAAKPIAEEFGISPVQMGYLFSCFLWTYILCLIPAGMMSDKAGSRTTALGGLGLWSLATVVTSMAGSFATLVMTRLVMGAGESTSYPAAARTIREWAPAHERGFATAVFNSGAYAGPALGAIFMGVLVGTFGWRVAFAVAGATGALWLVFAIPYYRRPEEARFLGKDEQDMILRTRDPESTGAPVARTPLLQLLKSTSMWGVALTQGCGVYTQYLFLTWLPGYLATTKNLDILHTGAYTALPYLGAVVLGIMLGRVSDRLLGGAQASEGKRRGMIIAMLLLSSVILLTPLIEQTWLILLLFTVSLTGISTAISLNLALTNDLLRSSADAGTATSVTVVGGNLFGVLAPIVTGYVIAASGSYSWAFIIAGILLLCGAVISFTLTRRPIEARPSAQPVHA